MGRVVLTLAVGALVVAGLALAGASASHKVAATLNAKQEVPKQAVKVAAASGAFSGKYVEKGKGATLTWKLSFAHLSGSALQAHIHQAKRGVAGNVIVALCAPCKNGQTGTSKITAAVIKALERGDAYVNVHTAKNPAGEIRGQIKVTG
ncbi:MAG: CHRD domain-containing protein [Gaiellaceae bacterium]